MLYLTSVTISITLSYHETSIMSGYEKISITISSILHTTSIILSYNDAISVMTATTLCLNVISIQISVILQLKSLH